MSVEILKEANQAGVRLFLSNGKLKVRAKSGALTPALKQKILSSKQELIELLSEITEIEHFDESQLIKPAQQGNNRLPLSNQQQRLWVLNQMYGASSEYNMPVAFGISGPFSSELALQTLREIISRHDILRTRFLGDGEEMWQEIIPDVEFLLREVDLQDIAVDAQRQEIDAVLNEDAIAPFDLSQGVLIRAIWIKQSPEQGVFSLNLHHIVSDGWSMDVLMREFISIYTALQKGQPSPLLPLTIQYSDYAAWQQQSANQEKLAKQLEYWQAQLKGIPDLHQIPLDYPRSDKKQGAGICHGKLDKTTTEHLLALARKQQMTPFMLLHGALSLLIARYSNHSDVVIGTPVANRLNKQLEPLIGFFVNSLALRVDVDESQKVEDYFTYIKDINHAALANQALPFESLVQALNVARVGTATPIFQIMLAMDNTRKSLAPAAGNIQISSRENTVEMAKFDITLNAEMTEDGLFLNWVYESALFNASTIEKMNDRLVSLLAKFTENVTQPLRNIQLMSEADVQALQAMQPSVKHYEPLPTLHQQFESQADKRPDAIAVTMGEQSITYRQLEAKANQLAHNLLSRDIQVGDIVGICMQRSPDMLVAMLAILKVGATYLPIDPKYPMDRIEFMLKDSGARLIIGQEDSQDNVTLTAVSAHWLSLSELDMSSYSAARLNVEVDSQQRAYIIYTSGSTGKPKGTQIAHQNVTRLFAASNTHFKFSEHDVWSMFHSFGFDFSVWEIWGALLYGGELLIVSYEQSRDPNEFYGLLHTHGVTVLNQTPTAFYNLIEALPEKVQLGRLRYVIFGGETLDTRKLAPWIEKTQSADSTKLINMYGITECTVHVTYKEVSVSEIQTDIASVGMALSDLTVAVVRDGQCVPPGLPGELWVSGQGVSQGYLARPVLNEEKFVSAAFFGAEQRWFKTGDIVRHLDNGELAFIGRNDNQVQLRGFRIELGEIETTINGLNGVQNAIVLLQEEQGNPCLVAHIQYDTVGDAEAQQVVVTELREQLRSLLPEHMIPAGFSLCEQFPLTLNGKIDKTALPEPVFGSAKSANYEMPRDDKELVLCDLWKSLLNLDKVGIHDNFFALGGDSILLIQLVSRANKVGLKFKVADLLSHQTIAQLSPMVERVVQEEVDIAPVIGDLPLLPMQRRFLENPAADHNYHNQTLLLDVPDTFTPDVILSITRALIERHDALRLRFSSTDDGWIAEHQELNDQMLQQICVTETLPEQTQALRDFVAQRCASYQKSLDITTGPLMKIVLMQGQSRSRLFVVFHHLVVDGVSWRIVFSDIQQAYSQIIQGQPIQLGKKLSSLQQWGRYLQNYADSEHLQLEKAFWLAQLSVDGAIPVEKSADGITTYSSTQEVRRGLNAEATQALIGECHEAYGTRGGELILAALYLTLAKWTGSDNIQIDTESHGREELDSGVLINEIVGWFTAIFPLSLRAKELDIATAIVQVKESLRSIPNNGIGFGILRYLKKDAELLLASEQNHADVLFNYLGRFDTGESQASELYLATEDSGQQVSPEQPRDHKLNVNVSVLSTELQIIFDYSEQEYSQQQIQILAEDMLAQLRAIIAHCQQQSKRIYTPADFPNAVVTLEQLQHWQQRYPLENIYTTTPMQKGVLFHSELDASAYIIQLFPVLRGEMDLDKFSLAWEHIADKYDILRSIFVGEKHALQQLVLPHYRPVINKIDLQHLDDVQQQQAFEKYRAQEKLKGFEIDARPLFNLSLFELGQKRYQLLWTFHHALLDGWSTPIVFRDVMHAYFALLAGQVPEAANPTNYEEYIRWLLQRDNNVAREYWHEYLAGVDSASRLKLPAKSQSIDPEKTERLRVHFSDAEIAHLNQFASAQKCTLNTLVQLGWALMLHRYSGDKKVTFGATVSGRPADIANIEDMVGLFINTIPVCVDVDLNQPLAQALETLQFRFQSSNEYGFLPLWEMTNKRDARGHVNLFDSLLVFQNFPIEANDENDKQSVQLPLLVEHVDSAGENSNYQITIVAGAGERFALYCDYRKDEFEGVYIEQLMAQFRHILMHMPAAQTLGDLGVLPEDLEQQLLHSNATEKPSVEDESTYQRFVKQVQVSGDDIAISCGDEHLTYSSLLQQVDLMAVRIQKEGIAQGDRVGMYLHAGPEMVTALLAILKLAAIYVPVEPDTPLQRVQDILADSGVKVVLTDNTNKARLVDIRVPVLSLDDADFQKEMQASNPAQCQAAEVIAEDIPYILYTSGSTGEPKGVQVTYRGFNNYLDHACSTYYAEQISGAVMSSPLSFDATITTLFTPLLLGKRLTILREKGEALAETLAAQLFMSEEAKLFKLTPAHLDMLLAYAEDQGLYSEQAHWLVIGGDQLYSHTLMSLREGMLPNGTFINEYGPTEAVVGCSIYIAEGKHLHTLGDVVPIGRPIQNTELVVLNDEQLAPLGVIGELYIGGSGVAKGYINKPAETQRRFVDISLQGVRSQRLYRTGDLVRWRLDGELEYVGRIDDQIKIRGMRVELGDIDSALNSHVWVHEGVVLAKGVGANKHLVAYVRPHSDTAGMTSEKLQTSLRSDLQQQLPAHMVPSRFVMLEQLPLTGNGKIDKAALPDVELQHTETQQVAPSNDIERKLSDIWCALLDLPSVGVHERFYEIGGNSLLALTLLRKINDQFDTDIAITQIFEFPTIKSMAEHLRNDAVQPIAEQMVNPVNIPSVSEDLQDIAIIGMSGRFPDADNLEQFWENIRDGHESIVEYTAETLKASGVSKRQFNHPDFVPKGVELNNIEQFDADCFGFSPREAEIMDPQQRLLFECGLEALEQSGYGNIDIAQNIGVFVGTSDSSYLYSNILSNWQTYGGMIKSVLQANSLPYIATRLSYKFNLNGPSMSLATACSTSLVAVHQACRSIRLGECEMALAGGASVSHLLPNGYIYQEGSIESRDGHCRPFDHQATGTRSGDGAGVILLKTLRKAQEDGDPILAVVKGSAVNNDASDKVGYTAPSISGQSRVIQAALDSANVTPQSIQFIETHGTGTQLGDPIEIQGLSRVFASVEADTRIGLGTLKANLGHLDAAAGIAGLIKMVLSLQNKLMPPSINYERANPNIHFADTPFYVNTKLQPWQEKETPVRVGISSFGIGGTNAHVVLEEAPKRIPPEQNAEPATADYCLIPLSARSWASLSSMLHKQADYLEQHQTLALQDIAYTLQTGRKQHHFREYVVAENVDTLVTEWRNRSVGTAPEKAKDVSGLIFMFSGQGSQYVNMTKDLYAQYPLFQQTVTQCSVLIQKLMGITIEDYLFADQAVRSEYTLSNTLITQPCLFAVEYATAKLLESWGVIPTAMIGHSLGEYVAACLAGVMALESAISIVCKRAWLMEQTESGQMLSIITDIDNAVMLAQQFQCSVAANNAMDSHVLSGPPRHIEKLQAHCVAVGITCKPINVQRAFHSDMMESVLEQFQQHLSELEFQAPQIPIISNVTGTYLTDSQAVSPEYWCQHLRHTVKFAQGIKCVLQQASESERLIFLEIGPGNTLTQLCAKQCRGLDAYGLTSIRRKDSVANDAQVILQTLGQLWQKGYKLDWEKLSPSLQAKRVSLPGYQFNRKRYWIAPSTQPINGAVQKVSNEEDWLYQASWSRQPLPSASLLSEADEVWVIFADQQGVSRVLAEAFEKTNIDCVLVQPGNDFEILDGSRCIIDPEVLEHYQQLFSQLHSQGKLVRNVVLLWTLDTLNLDTEKAVLHSLGILSGLNILRACPEKDLNLCVVTGGTESVLGDEVIVPHMATMSALNTVATQEYPNIHTRQIDLQVNQENDNIQVNSAAALALFSILTAPQHHKQVAMRGNSLWVKGYTQYLPSSQEAEHDTGSEPAVFVITGGLGQIGLLLAGEIAQQYPNSHLVLLGRTGLPAREKWPTLLAGSSDSDPIVKKVQRIQALESQGATCHCYAADVSDELAMQAVFTEVQTHTGKVTGVIHCAGSVDDHMCALESSDAEDFLQQYQSKVFGTLVLDKVLAKHDVKFCLLMSSLSVVLGGVGYGTYAAANAFMDAFAYGKHAQGDTRWSSINWDGWDFSGRADLGAYVMTPEEGARLFSRILKGQRLPCMVNSTGLLQHRLNRWVYQIEQHQAETPANLGYEYQEDDGREIMLPSNIKESALLAIWQEILGLNRIDVNENFFELGGDSLVAIRLVSLAEKQQMKLKVSQLYDYPTIKLLATAISDFTAETQDIAPIKGEQKLLPIHQLALVDRAGLDLVKVNHFNMATQFEVSREYGLDALQLVVRRIVERHDALRLTFCVNGVSWSARYQPLEDILPRVCVHETLADEQHFLPVCQKYQQAMALDEGPLIRFVLMTAPNVQRLLVLQHHSVGDVISWQILSNDLQDAMVQYAKSGTVGLGRKSSSYQDWGNYLHECAKQQTFSAELPFWLGHDADNLLPLAPLSEDVAYVTDVSFAQVQLSVKQTSQLEKALAKLNISLDVALISALHYALVNWTGSCAVPVMLESNGRDSAGSGLDFSQTIGWFTQNYPILLSHLPQTFSLTENLLKTASLLDEVPNGGVGYGTLRYLQQDPELVAMEQRQRAHQVFFNYLGKSEQPAPNFELIDPFYCGDLVPRDWVITRDLVFKGGIYSDGLVMNIEHNKKRFNAEAVASLVNFIQSRLIETIAELAAESNE